MRTLHVFFLGGDPNPSRYDDLVQDDSNALAILDDYFTGVSWLIIGNCTATCNPKVAD